MWENETKIDLKKEVYSPYILLDKTVAFIEKNKDNPFFLYLTPTLPHAELLVPDSEMEPFKDSFFEIPFTDDHYANQDKPRAAYAAMVTRIDKDIQQITELLEKYGLLENTMIVFTSDNGAHMEGGHDPDYFDSNGAFRGTKRDLYDGGIRTPFIVHWPAQIQPGKVSFHVAAFWDFLPTACEILDLQPPVVSDGISYLSALTGKGEQARHEYLYWEFHEQGGKQAVLKDNWKIIRLFVNQPERTKPELYNLSSDPSEQLNVSGQYPGKTAELESIIDRAHTNSSLFPFVHEQK